MKRDDKKGTAAMSNVTVLDALYETIATRKDADPGSSYTASLFARGTGKCAQKLGEEAVETVIAAMSGEREQIIFESADLIYHLFVVLAQTGITPDEVYTELQNRTGQSGLDEKASRKK